MNKEEKNALIEEYGEEAVNAYIKIEGEEYATAGRFEESYQGEWGSDEDFVRQLLEDTEAGLKELPPYIHIDWERTARDIMMDYVEEDGFYFSNI